MDIFSEVADTVREAERSTSRKGGQRDGPPVYGAPVSASGTGVDHLCVWAGDPTVSAAGGTSPHPSQGEDGQMGGGQTPSSTAVMGFSATCACASALYTVCREAPERPGNRGDRNATLHHIPTVSPLMIPLVYCHIKSFQRASSVGKPLPRGEKRRDGRAAHPVAW